MVAPAPPEVCGAKHNCLQKIMYKSKLETKGLGVKKLLPPVKKITLYTRKRRGENTKGGFWSQYARREGGHCTSENKRTQIRC